MRSSATIQATALAAIPDLAMAAEIGAALTATTSLADLLGVQRQRLKWLLPAAYVSLCLLEDDGASYRVLTLTSRDASGEAATLYPLDEGLVGWALQRRTALDIPDLQDETRLPPDIGGVALHQGQGALLVLPL